MSWQLLVAISVITSSISILLQRVLLHDEKSDPIAYAIAFQGLVGILVGIYAVVVGGEMPDFQTLWLPIAITCILFAAANVVAAKALQQAEASVFSILLNTRAFWVMLFGVILFHEHIGIAQMFGSILIFLSICLIAERKGDIRFDRGIILGLRPGCSLD